VHSVDQRSNLRHFCGELKAWSKQWVLRRRWKECGEEQARMST